MLERLFGDGMQVVACAFTFLEVYTQAVPRLGYLSLTLAAGAQG